MLSRRKRPALQSGEPPEGVKGFCELFPPEFRTACDPYCWACGSTDRSARSIAGGDRCGHRSPHAALVDHPSCPRQGDGGAIAHETEDEDYPYIWDRLEECCQCR